MTSMPVTVGVVPSVWRVRYTVCVGASSVGRPAPCAAARDAAMRPVRSSSFSFQA